MKGRFREAIEALEGLAVPAWMQPEVDQCLDAARRGAKCHLDIDGNLIDEQG